MKAIRHPLVKPLLGGNLWADLLTRHRCEFFTPGQQQCKNDATHVTTERDDRGNPARCCFAHAVQFIEYRTGEFVDVGMTEIVDPETGCRRDMAG